VSDPVEKGWDTPTWRWRHELVRDLLEDLGFGVIVPTPLFLDSKSALDLAADPVAFKKTKHILCHAYELRMSCVIALHATEHAICAAVCSDRRSIGRYSD